MLECEVAPSEFLTFTAPLLAAHAHAASFDCAKASTPTERDPAGTRVPLLPARFIDKANATPLDELARQTEYTNEARGIAESSGDGHVYFSPGACRYVFRLPQSATSNRGSKP